MKIAVYTIAKNEAQFVQRWAESAAGADVRVILDTGSTDDTVERAVALGVTVHRATISPWRFDQARNVALALLPADIDLCIALDMDEVLQPGWREALEALPSTVTRPRYEYVWSWKPDGAPDLVYSGDKVHRRHGYVWRHPVHEVLTPTAEESARFCEGFLIHHHPDASKSRGQYLTLLEQAVRERPEDDRNAFYYARELLFTGDSRAAGEFRRHLALPNALWAPERAASMRYLAQCDVGMSESWLLRACAEAPDSREPWVELAEHYYRLGSWAACYTAAVRATSILVKRFDYLIESRAWGALPWDLRALSAHHLGRKADAIVCGETALELEPGDARLQGNLEFYRA